MGSESKTSQSLGLDQRQLPDPCLVPYHRVPKGAPDTSSRKVSIQDVANAARVSTGTVSRVANDATSVNVRMRRRVLAAMHDLKYKANPQAIALVRGRSRLLGLVVPDSRNSFTAELIQDFQRCALAEGYETMVCCYADNDPTRCALRLRERRVEGAAVALPQSDDGLAKQLAHLAVPAVMLDTTCSAMDGSHVEVEYYPGTLQAIRYLAALGHRRIGFVPGALSHQFAQAHLDAFSKSCQALGIVLSRNEVFPQTYTLTGGHEIIAGLIRSKEPPTALCCSDVAASHGIQQAIANCRGQLHKGMSLIACADAPSLGLTAPSITAIGVETNRVAEALLNELMRLRNPEQPQKAGSVIPTRLIVRCTTRPPF